MTDVALRPDSGITRRALERWLGGLTLNTARAYSTDLAAWLAWCASAGVNVGEATGRDLAEYLAGIPVGVAAKARRYAAIRSFYEWARDEGLTEADPKPTKAQRPWVKGYNAARLGGLTEGQARDLVAAADASGPRLSALVALLLTTGLRISEALSIDQLDVNPSRTTVTVLGKGRKTRTVVVPPFAAERCSKLGSPLFVTRTGRRMSSREAWESIKRLGVRAGIPNLHPHMLRHTAATLALLDGTNVVAVQAMLGHSSLGTTQRYVEAAASLEHSPADVLAAKIAPRQESQ